MIITLGGPISDDDSVKRLNRDYLRKAFEEIRHGMGVKDLLPRVTNIGDVTVLEFEEVPNKVGPIITLFMLYYDLDSGWFYITDPRKVIGVPVFHVWHLTNSLGLSVPVNLREVFYRYKFTGKLEDLAEDLVGSAAKPGTFMRYLLSEGGEVKSVSEVLKSLRYRIPMLISAVSDVELFSDTATSEQRKTNTPGVAAWYNMRTTLRSMVIYQEDKMLSELSLFRAGRIPEDDAKALKRIDDYIYRMCIPDFQMEVIYRKGDRSEMKARNSYDVLSADMSSRQTELYFSLDTFEAKTDPLMGLIDGKERNAVNKMVNKYRDYFDNSINSENGYEISGDFDDATQGRARVGRALQIARRVADRIGKVG